MMKFTDFMKTTTPTELIVMQANLAKATLAYVPNEDLRDRLASAIELNAALATALWDAFFSYNNDLRAKVLTR